jgi:hypothetical protein
MPDAAGIAQYEPLTLSHSLCRLLSISLCASRFPRQTTILIAAECRISDIEIDGGIYKK